MTFRPSVVPDRDNDIISTFTRSFEQARNFIRTEQANKRAQQAFELDQRIRTQELEDREFDAAIARGQPGTIQPSQLPGATGDRIADAFATPQPREPVGAGGLFPGAPEQPSRQPGLAIDPSQFFADGAPADGAPADGAPADGAPVAAPSAPRLALAPTPDAQPDLGTGGVGIRTEPAPTGDRRIFGERPEFTRPGFLPEPELPADFVPTPGGGGFSESLRRLQGRQEGAADITAEEAAIAETDPGRRAAAAERRAVTGFEGRTPAEEETDKAEADAFRTQFPDELETAESDLEAIFLGNMLARQRELTERNTGIGGVAGRAREANIQRFVDQQLAAIGRQDFPPGREGDEMRARFRANAERQVDATSEDEPSEDRTTAELVLAAEIAEQTPEQKQQNEARADSFISEIEGNTRSLRGVQEDIEFASSTQKRLLEPLLIERVLAKWDDPEEPWSDPANRPGAGIAFLGFGAGQGPAAFKEANTPQEIVDIIMGRNIL